MSNAFLLLDPSDTVLICIADGHMGDKVNIDSEITLKQEVTIGHKIARNDAKAGSKVLKYGVPIGSLIKDVKAGEHVHTHNMKSDYIPAHMRE